MYRLIQISNLLVIDKQILHFDNFLDTYFLNLCEINWFNLSTVSILSLWLYHIQNCIFKTIFDSDYIVKNRFIIKTFIHYIETLDKFTPLINHN